MTFQVIPITERSPVLVEQLVRIWEASVRPTHLFLAESDIAALRPEVVEGLRTIPLLAVAFDEDIACVEPCTPIGFAGVAGDTLEMLFLDPSVFGQGLGGRLLTYAVERFGARKLDVNEDNPSARGFYEHEGFKAVGRSEFDNQGRSFPLIHMQLP